ncbi:MAG: 3-dehydroquinate synthase [Candidatus Hydrogenedentes bacterium]|nr:3-dehydroquinate synthase [Candidatus Hydrogenedentota bacterium]
MQTGNIQSITVDLGKRSYPIHIGTGTIEILPDTLRSLGVKCAVAIASDDNVAPIYGERVAALVREAGVVPHICAMPGGEAHKRMAQIDRFIGEFLKAGMDRTSVVIALGGGVVGDVVGYAAASFMRGVRFIQIPTTIVAQVDSSVGGKTAVNHELAKNIIGAFHQPSAVIIDLDFLKSLPDRELRAGLAEVIKHGVIADAALFAYMEENADAILAKDLDKIEFPVRRSCEIKGAIVSEDEHEHGVRANLNYGHTFGHGIEAASNYSQFLHGEAIALGMHAAATLARDLGMVDQAFVDRQRGCIEAYGLPVAWPQMPIDRVLEAMRHDKKVRAGTMKFIVPDLMGHVVHRTDVTVDQARTALEALMGSV